MYDGILCIHGLAVIAKQAASQVCMVRSPGEVEQKQQLALPGAANLCCWLVNRCMRMRCKVGAGPPRPLAHASLFLKIWTPALF